MYGSVLPSYSSDKDKKGESIDADDQENRDRVRNILFDE